MSASIGGNASRIPNGTFTQSSFANLSNASRNSTPYMMLSNNSQNMSKLNFAMPAAPPKMSMGSGNFATGFGSQNAL